MNPSMRLASGREDGLAQVTRKNLIKSQSPG